jgi:outer membrane protein TolC
VSELPSAVEEAEGQLAQLKEDLKKAQTDRAAAKAAIAEATAIREKEAGEFAGVSTDLKTNIAAIGKAIKAIEAGMGGASCRPRRPPC